MAITCEAFKLQCLEEKLIPLGFIGCGNMAKAIVSGLIEAKMFKGDEILVSGTKAESFEKWKDLGVSTTLLNGDIAVKCRIIFLCIKPSALPKVVASIAYEYGKPFPRCDNKTIVSILAGTSIATIQESFKFLTGMSFIRAMPNTPLMVCAGATAMTELNPVQGTEIQKSNAAMVKSIFATLGAVEFVDEKLFHAITGLSGSGPAYVYIMIEALSDAGVKQGLPRDLATKFAAQTMFGASKTILDTGLHTGQAKDQVTSAGGTTIHGVHELEKGRIRDTLMNTVEAATKRSMELAKQN